MNNIQLKYKSTMMRLGGILLIFVGLLSVLFFVYNELPIYFLPEPAVTVVASILYDVMYMASFMLPALFVPIFFKAEERQPMRLDVKLPTNTFAFIFIGVAFCYAFSHINAMAVDAMFVDDTVEELFNYPEVYVYMSDTDIILEFITIALVPAFCEEFLFRGVVLSTLMPYGKSTAVVVSAVCFGLMHGNFYQFLYTTVAGIILGAVYVATDSIWPSTLIHMMNNALSVFQMVIYERMSEERAYILWLVIETLVMMLGVISFIYLVRHKKHSENKKSSVFGKSLGAVTVEDSTVFSANAKLEAKDAVKAFFAPTIIAFVIYNIFLAFYAIGTV